MGDDAFDSAALGFDMCDTARHAFDSAALGEAERVEWLQHLEDIRGLPTPRPSQDPTPLAAGLWLGSAWSAKDPEALARHGIRAVVNAASEFKGRFQPLYPKTWGYLELDVVDALDVMILRDHWGNVFPFMKHYADRGARIFVHCMMGQNRSATVCVAFLMCHLGWPLPKALHHVVVRRPTVVENKTFQEELILLAKLCGLMVKDPVVDQVLQAAYGPAVHVWQLAAGERCDKIAVPSLAGVLQDIKAVERDGHSQLEVDLGKLVAPDGTISWDVFKRWIVVGFRVRGVGWCRASTGLVDAILSHMGTNADNTERCTNSSVLRQ